MTPNELADCSILLIDDEEANLDLLEEFLRSEGYRALTRTTDSTRVGALLDSSRPDLVLLDLHMPHRSGFEVLRDIRARRPREDYLPVLVLTADVTPEAKERALSDGANDFLTKPFDIVEVLLRVRNLLETRRLYQAQCEAREFAEAAARRAALLAESSQVLAASFDYATTLPQLAALLVPRLGSWCVVGVQQGETLLPLGTAHSTPGNEAVVRHLFPAGAPHPLVRQALHAGTASVVGPLTRSGDGSSADSTLEALGLGALALVPLRLQGRSFGILLLARSSHEQSFTSDDLTLLEEIATRSSLAIENARLFADAQWATRARDRMLSIVAHDLRNPLTIVVMHAEMVLELMPPDDPAYPLENLNGIMSATARMQRLIDDLLDVSRVEGGTFTLHTAEHSIASLFEEADELFQPLAESRDVGLRCVPPEAPLFGRFDRDRVVQVLSNLVGNALKFTPEGGAVEVTCSALDGRLRISVADNGPGIPAEQIPHIFGAFWQAREGDREGVGLGLWIARSIVEAHGGQIWVDSREGYGTTFHFTLPGTAASGEILPLPSGSLEAVTGTVDSGV